jgi:hypothetical protein
VESADPVSLGDAHGLDARMSGRGVYRSQVFVARGRVVMIAILADRREALDDADAGRFFASLRLGD